MNIAQWLYTTARTHPTNPALLAGETIVADYARFARRSSALAAWLGERYGLATGDRVGIFMKNRTEYLETLYAIWWLGGVAVPINAKLHGKEAAWILNDAEAKVAIISDDVGHVLEEPEMGLDSGCRVVSVESDDFQNAHQDGPLQAPMRREPDDLAWLFYTSGTTGKPKGVMISNANLIAMSLCYPVDVDPVTSADAALYSAPISHGAGMYNFIHVRCAARHVVPLSGGFDGDEVLGLAKKLGNVSMFAAPTMVQRLVAAAKARNESGDGIKTIVYGGGPMYLADIEAALDQLGPRFVQIFGQGETPMTITAVARRWHTDTKHPRYRERLASVGTAQSAVQVRVTGTDGKEVPAGEVGEVEVKGSTVMLGYWKQPEATAETIRDGWLRTGDMGILDQDGFLTLRDRSKDVVISGGTNIYPREVEEALLTHPDVREVAVIGKPDPEWGEIVTACIVVMPGRRFAPDALDRHCLSSIARFKRPKLYVDFAELPKNNYGKVLKTALRDAIDERQPENNMN